MHFINRIGDYARGSNMVQEDLEKLRSQKCETNEELLEWWKGETTKREKEDYENDLSFDVQQEIDDEFLDKIFDIKYLIALDSNALFREYLINFIEMYWND